MRIWDISPENLCANHLLGEHRELHAIWSILTNNKKGYSKHPETLRWKGKLKALYNRHEKLVKEMKNRGYNHKSPLNIIFAVGQDKQHDFVDTVDEQIRLLRTKGCKCKL
jgi:hypothetical protein